MRHHLEQYFEFAHHRTTWRTEMLAGLTTFVTMAYIIFVNPAILSKTGMPIAAVTAATCLCAAFGSILMGAMARYPLALAPGMGLNAYFTYTVCLKMHIPWQTALGAVFLSGVMFLLLTFGGIRQLLVAAIPQELHAAIAGGVGLFIAFIGLTDSGIIVKDPATAVTLGNLHAPQTALALFGLLLIALLQVFRVKASILIGIAGTMLTGFIFGEVHWAPTHYRLSDISATAFKLDVPGALHIGGFEIIFVFLFVDLFDNIGTLVAVTEKAGLLPLANFPGGRHVYRRRLARRYQHRMLVHRELGRRRRGWPNGRHRHHHRPSLSRRSFYRPPRRSHPNLCDCARAGHRRRPHALVSRHHRVG